MSEVLKPSVRASGGTPNGFPDYRPINKIPRHELAEQLKRAIKPALYQVWVETRSGGSLAVSPKCPQGTAVALADAIRTQIRLGNEKIWGNPQVLLVL